MTQALSSVVRMAIRLPDRAIWMTLPDSLVQGALSVPSLTEATWLLCSMPIRLPDRVSWMTLLFTVVQGALSGPSLT